MWWVLWIMGGWPRPALVRGKRAPTLWRNCGTRAILSREASKASWSTLIDKMPDTWLIESGGVFLLNSVKPSSGRHSKNISDNISGIRFWAGDWDSNRDIARERGLIFWRRRFPIDDRSILHICLPNQRLYKILCRIYEIIRYLHWLFIYTPWIWQLENVGRK